MTPGVLAELATFGVDAERLGLTPALIGNDPTFALQWTVEGEATVYSWEIDLREYDAEAEFLGMWLVDNIGNRADIGPSGVDGDEKLGEVQVERSRDGMVHVRVRPYED